MRKSVQKNHNKAESKEIHAPHPTNKKKHRFHPLKQDKIGTIIFQFHFTDPLQTLIRPITDPSDTSDLSDLSDTKSISEIYHQACKTVRSVRSV